MNEAPPSNLGIGVLAGVLAGTLFGAIFGAIPVGVAAGAGLGALADWWRYHPKDNEEEQVNTLEESAGE